MLPGISPPTPCPHILHLGPPTHTAWADVPAVDAQCVSSPSPDAFASWGQSRIWVGGGLEEATSAGWIDPSSRRKDWAPCRGRGCHGCSRWSRREEGEEWSEAPPRGFWKYLDTRFPLLCPSTHLVVLTSPRTSHRCSEVQSIPEAEGKGRGRCP